MVVHPRITLHAVVCYKDEALRRHTFEVASTVVNIRNVVLAEGVVSTPEARFRSRKIDHHHEHSRRDAAVEREKHYRGLPEPKANAFRDVYHRSETKLAS